MKVLGKIFIRAPLEISAPKPKAVDAVFDAGAGKSMPGALPLFARAAPLSKSPAPLSKRGEPLFRSPSPLLKSASPLSKGPSPISKRGAPLFISPSPLSKSPSPLFKSAAPLFKRGATTGARGAPLFVQNQPLVAKQRLFTPSAYANCHLESQRSGNVLGKPESKMGQPFLPARAGGCRIHADFAANQ